MSTEEVSVYGGIVRVTEAKVVGSSRYNLIKAENRQQGLSVHFRPDGLVAPGPREALLVAIVNGIKPAWLDAKRTGVDGRPVDIHFRAISAEAGTDKPYDVGGKRPAMKSSVARTDDDANLSDMLHMSTIERDNMTRLQLTMTNENSHVLHAAVVLSKGQVTQMIATLLVLYERLHED